MSVKTDSELTASNNSRLPDNNVRFISAEKVRSQMQDVIDSKINKADIKGIISNPITEQYWKSPDGNVWRLSIGNDGEIQKEIV